MGGKDGGTMMFCPHCEDWTVCTAIPPVAVESGFATDGLRSQQVAFTEPPEIKYFRRGRECHDCGAQWLTAEIPEALLEDLIGLLRSLGDLKGKAESYSAQAEAAAKALSALDESVASLRALSLYRAEED